MGKLTYEDDPKLGAKGKGKSGEITGKTPEEIAAQKAKIAAQNNVTMLAKVDPNQVYNANTDAGNILGKDVESAYWNIFNGPANGGGGGGGKIPQLSLADRGNEFGNFQNQTTKFTSDLMTGAGDTANGMFGQGVYNQMTGDNDQVVQGDLQALQEQFGGNVNHPAFIKAKNEMLMNAKMYNAKAYTDLKQKSAQYGLDVATVAKNYYDVYSTREEDQQKLKLATDQFNIELKMKKQQMNQAAGARAQGMQLAALAAITANRKFESGQATDWSTTELQARSADKVTNLNLQMEQKKLDAAQAAANKQKSSNIFGAILGTVGTILGGPVGGAVGGLLGGLFGGGSTTSGSSTPVAPRDLSNFQLPG